MSIRAKLMLGIVASMIGLAFVAGAFIRVAGERTARSAAERAVFEAGQVFQASEQAEIEKLDATVEALSAHPGLAQAFATRDRDKLLALATPVFTPLRDDHDITHFYFLEPEPSRTCFLRVHRPDWFGDVVERETLTKAIETKKVGAGKELGKTAFALRVVRPWFSNGKLLGYLELGEEIDRFLVRMKAETGDDYGLLVEKSFLDEKEWAGTRQGRRNNWGDRPETVVVDATTPDEAMLALDRDLTSIPDQGLLLDEDDAGGKTFVRGVIPVKDAAGRRVGGLFVLHDITALQRNMLAARRGVYVLAAAVAAALGIVLHLLVSRLVFRRLDAMIVTMEGLSARLAGGDYDIVPPRASGGDEIGRFEEFFGRFLRVIAGLLKELPRNRSG